MSMQDKEQVIKVDHKTMLAKIMTVLGARSPPLFTEFDCGEEGVKISIKLDLSFGQTSSIQDVEGQTLLTKDAAETSAVMMAFKHLEKDIHIKVLDFSSRVARSFGAYNTYSYVNETMGLVQKMLHNFDMALGKCKKLALELEGEEKKETTSDDLDGNGLVYDVLGKYLWTVVKSFSFKSSSAHNKMNDLEFDRMQHRKKATEKAKTMANKVSCAKMYLVLFNKV